MAFVVKTIKYEAITTTGFQTYQVANVGERSALITSVRVVNESTTNSATLNFYVKPSGTSIPRLVAKQGQVLAPKAMLVLEDAMTLGKLDSFQMEVSGTSPTLAWTIFGLERD